MERPIAAADIQTALTALLENRLGNSLAAAFIYGSVASDRASAQSDIDCMVLVSRPLPPEQLQRVRHDFAALQARLGFVPDDAHPVEIFSVDDCRSALDSAVLSTALQQADGHGAISAELAGCDEVEILRALLDRRIELRASTELHRLTAHARQLIHVEGGDDARLRALGLSCAP